MKHDDLWNDALKDTLPPDVQLNSLARMQTEASRIRFRRRALRASAIVAVVALAGWLALPKRGVQAPSLANAPDNDATTSIKPASVANAAVSYLDDAELITRLRDLGVGIGVADSEEGKQILLVSRDGEVFRP